MASPCTFRQEDAFLSSLPLVSLEKHLYARSRRNMLTLAPPAAIPSLPTSSAMILVSCWGSTSITIRWLLPICSTAEFTRTRIWPFWEPAGSGKSFTLQLFALRLRRKNIQVFILAPLKGHEFYRAARNIGGEIIQISPSSPHCINVMEIRPVGYSGS